MSNKSKRWIWIDLEMTGLEPDRDHIIEIATIVTDHDLNVVAQGPELAIHQSDALLAGMDEWNTKQHNGSGLVKRVKESAITDAMAEQQTIDFLQEYVKAGTSPICGNSVHQDRRFLNKYMPKLADFFHYRNLDVSTLKILATHWNKSLAYEKESNHLALDDIKQSIEELRYYREHFLVAE
jgi:oligoribonuclease